jgi:hypothetical protein
MIQRIFSQVVMTSPRVASSAVLPLSFIDMVVTSS